MTAFWWSERSPERSEDIGLEWVYLNQQHAQHFLTANGRHTQPWHTLMPWADGNRPSKATRNPWRGHLEKGSHVRIGATANGEGQGLSQSNHLPNVHNIWIYTESGALFFFVGSRWFPTQSKYTATRILVEFTSCPSVPHISPGHVATPGAGQHDDRSDGTRRLWSHPNLGG